MEGYHESRRCSRDTYPESYITKYTSIRRETDGQDFCVLQVKMNKGGQKAEVLVTYEAGGDAEDDEVRLTPSGLIS